ncbi:MAG TPA: tubulin-like doman-containing protein [Blastocatellia bacterium]|nr:tubulin-like doman-containing protein [Blastocatellia bacterium]
MAEDQTKIIDGIANKVRNVAPTILIGVGGTGKEVLLRLRRRFYERYNMFGFDTVSYLWIDTDTRNRNIDDQPLDHIMEQVMFREEERVSAEVPGEAFMGYFGDKRTSPHLFSWLDPKLAALGSVLHGARQVRPLGRLAFFHSHTDIRRKLDAALAKVRAQTAIESMQRRGIAVDGNALDIIIICSLAGGTGSGMFLDTAFLCKDALPNPDITGYLLLPSVFADAINGSEKIYANGYAALKELEYYSLRKDLLAQYGEGMDADDLRGETSRHDFVADWENAERNAGIKPKPIPSPPFNTCYLIDNITQGGGMIGPKDKSHLCDMIAENIFLNFSSEEFSRMKDSVRSNLEDALGKPLMYSYDEYGRQGGYTEILAQRYSTFGFSKLYVPVDRIRRACGYQLSLDIISRWLMRNEVSEIEIERRLQERELANLGLRAGSGGDDFVDELRRVGESTFEEEIRAEVSRWRDTLLQQVNTEKRPELYGVIPRLLKEFTKKNYDRTDPRTENWGAYLKTLEQNRDRFVRQALGEFDMAGKRKTDGRILEQVKQWLKDDHVRLYLAIEYLKVLGKILDHHVAELYVKAKESQDRRAASSLEDIKIKLEMVRDEESGWFVQRKSLRALVEHLCDRMREHLIARMNSFVLGAAIDIIQNKIKPYLGKEEIRKDAKGQEVTDRAGLILELWSLRDDLTALYSQLKDRFESFEAVKQDLIFENLYKQGMFRDFYRIQRPEGEYPVPTKLDELESLLFQRLAIVNPHDLRGSIKDRGAERVLYDIENFCYTQFQELEVSADVLESFKLAYPTQEERTRRLQRLVNNGSVWVQKSKQATTRKQLTQNRADTALISISAANSDRFREIYNEIDSLVKAAGFPTISHPTSKRADAVFLYTEYAGIPLAYVRDLDRYYQEAYLPLVRQGAQLHIDYHEEKFTDILIKGSDEIDLTLRANRALLVGAILRAVNANPDGNGDVTFSFTSLRDGMANVQQLGAGPIAIETLKRNGKLMEAVEGEITKRRGNLSPEARLKFYTLLAYHIMDKKNPDGYPAGPFAPYQKVTAQGVINYHSPECKAIQETQSDEYQQLVHKLGGEDSVQTGYKRLYPTQGEPSARLSALDKFSQEVLINNRRMRILKDGVD